MSDTPTTNTNYARPLSELNPVKNNFLDQNSIIEISRDGTSYRTTLKELDKVLINNFQLYNNLNEIFNSTKHLNETYFGAQHKEASFTSNPFIDDVDFHAMDSDYEMLITRSDLNDYFADYGVSVPVCTPDAKYMYYIADEKRWTYDSIANPREPQVQSNTLDGIWTSDSYVKFNFGNSLYYYTTEVEAPKNCMLNATGNIVLDMNYEDKWYSSQHYFVALTIDSKIITLVFLKNIVNIKDKNGTNYVIGQFHLNCPLTAKTKFKIITNAKCKLFGMPEGQVFTRKLYDSLNAVCLGFYDSW